MRYAKWPFVFHRYLDHAQWKDCVFLHIGTWGFGAQILPQTFDGRSWGLELCTPSIWFRLRPFAWTTWRRRP